MEGGRLAGLRDGVSENQREIRTDRKTYKFHPITSDETLYREFSEKRTIRGRDTHACRRSRRRSMSLRKSHASIPERDRPVHASICVEADGRRGIYKSGSSGEKTRGRRSRKANVDVAIPAATSSHFLLLRRPHQLPIASRGRGRITHGARAETGSLVKPVNKTPRLRVIECRVIKASSVSRFLLPTRSRFARNSRKSLRVPKSINRFVHPAAARKLARTRERRTASSRLTLSAERFIPLPVTLPFFPE